MVSSNQLRKGTVYKDGAETLMVIDYSHQKYGRGQATIRVKVKNLETGSSFEKTYDTSARFEEADVSRESVQFLYADGDYYFMNNTDYTQFSLDDEALGESKYFLKEGVKVVAIYLEGKAIGIELPKSIELEVIYAEPAVAGDTSGNASKNVKLETGLEVSVPLFIEKGDILKINTENKDYISRV